MKEEKQVVLNNWQSKVWIDEHRYVVIDVGRRGGKSTLSALKIATFAQTHPNSVIYYVSPTYQQSKSIMWEMLKSFLPAHWIKSMKEWELKIELTNGCRIELKGADTEPDRLRGVKIDFLICDEVAFFKNWAVVWNNVLRPTLIDSKGSAIFISTPLGYNHFYDLYMKGQSEAPEDAEWSSYKFTSYDNQYLDPLEIDKARAEMDEDTFQQEFMAEFKRYTGLVFKYFTRERHFIPPIEFGANWTFYRGIDFGWTNPSAVPFVAVSPDGKLYVYDLIYQTGLTSPDLALLIKQKSVGRSFSGTWADSAQSSDISEIRQYGLSITPVSKSASSGNKGEDWITYKVRKMNELIKANKLFIFNNLDMALFEMENYQYKEVREGDTVRERPAAINNHFIDALSYIIVNLPTYMEQSFVETSETYQEEPDWFINRPRWSGVKR